MGQRVCSSCGGRGSHFRSTTVSDFSPGAGPAYKTVNREETCTSCMGSGMKYVEDPPIKIYPPGQKEKEVTKDNSIVPPGYGGGTKDTWTPKDPPEKSWSGLKLLLAFFGAFVGYSMTPPFEEAGVYVLIGGVAGYLLFPVLRFLFKLLVYAIMVFILVLIGYGIFSFFFGG